MTKRKYVGCFAYYVCTLFCLQKSKSEKLVNSEQLTTNNDGNYL